METNDRNTPIPVSPGNEPSSNGSGRVLGGLVIVAIGGIFLADKLGFFIPGWIFTWPMILIAAGIFVGAKHSFRGGKWLIPIVIGSVFLLSHLTIIDLNIGRIFWPVIIIIIGIMMIIKPKRNRSRDHWGHWKKDYYAHAQTSTEDVLDSVTIFGSVKKNIISKEFKGGESVCVFGGTELNMMQADINGRVIVEIVQVFGGTKLIVPANWQIQSEEMVSIFGGLEDKRPLPSGMNVDHSKILVLRGTCLFGGINIKSY